MILWATCAKRGSGRHPDATPAQPAKLSNGFGESATKLKNQWNVASAETSGFPDVGKTLGCVNQRGRYQESSAIVPLGGSSSPRILGAWLLSLRAT